MITSQYFNITSDASIFASNRHISNKQHCAVWVKSLTNVWSQIPYNDFDLVNNSIILDTALLSTIYSQVELRVADSQEELGTPVTDISATASIRDEVIVVADNIDSITTVSENIVNLNNIADNIVKAGVVADNIVDVNNVADNIVSISSLASIRTQLESIYTDKTKLTSIYNDKITLDSIYSDKSKLDAIFSDLNAIEGLFSIKAKLESIYADKSKLDSIYADKTQLDTIYNNISNILTVYTNISSVIAVSNNIASVNTTASNIVSVNTFSSKYKISSTQPSSPTAGDLWYDTVATVLKYYNGSSYIAVSPDITFKQDTLVSGTNIKTINSSTILGSGNINLVDLTTNQTIDGVKTFSSSPIVPTPTTDFQSATKQYVDYTSTQYTTYGLGTRAILNNLFDSFLNTGFYKQSTGGDSPHNYSTILKIKHELNADADLLFVHTAPSVIIKARTSTGGTRNSWVELMHSGNEKQIGVSQTWQDVTASRALGVTYTNTTGKPIMVSATVQGIGAGTTTASGYVNSTKACQSWASYTISGPATGSSVEFIVPNGATYYVSQSGSSSTSLYSWAELK